MPKNPAMGSPDWANHVFASPPARRLKGHSRRTQHHRYYSSRLNTIVGVQGRNECCTAFAIEYLMTLGLIRRAKPQPFITEEKEFGNAICPDFLLEASDDHTSLVVIETKSARFFTRAKNLELDAYRESFVKHGMRYLVWTDRRPLSHPVRHHLMNMRASAQRDVPAEEVEKLVTWLDTSPKPTLPLFYKAGFFLDTLYAAAWEGKVFFHLTKPFSESSVLSRKPLEDYQAIFLNCENRADDWWTNLLKI